MAKSNNKEKLTYKQMLGYMDFLNNNVNEGFKTLDESVNGLGFYLRAFVEYAGKTDDFTEYLKNKHEEAKKEEERLGSVAQNKSPEMEK